MFDALLLAFPEPSQEFFAGCRVKIDLFNLGGLAEFESRPHYVE